MTSQTNLLFLLCTGLAILFLLWVLVRVTAQLSAPKKAARLAQRDSRYLRVISQSQRPSRFDAPPYGFAAASGVSASSAPPSTSTAEPGARSKAIPG